MYLFDSLSKTKKYLPEKSEISIYLCGPTLYNRLHLGNLRPIITFDFLIRYLKNQNIPYYFVQNLTDVDEKILKKAFKEKRSVTEVVAEYYKSFVGILHNINIIWPNNLPTVSDHIKEIQSIIEALLNTNKASWDKSSQTIKYLQTSQDKSLNYFYSQETDITDEADFALWKENKISTFNFDSPWFKGIPGWHIECFAMIQKHFSLPITIHGGGVDLKFPHHENENLLSRSVFNKDLAEIWVHVGQVLNEEGKLSKSSNYTHTIEECVERYSWEFLRYIFMKNKYNKPLTISTNILEKYWNEWKTYISALNFSEAFLSYFEFMFFSKNNPITSPNTEFLEKLEEDLNLPEVLSILEAQKNSLLSALKQKNLKEIFFYREQLSFHLQWLGFKITPLSIEQKKKSHKWLSLLDSKEYEAADKIRTQLISEGILP